ncbi:TetR family transcriptional regulator [Pseudonocardia ailaonensis]|uniref:TetR family transcriptional regulator n=1 Tax=Pseudonocardia ailaonensis TaxID=367279 RepID=A0ABN2N7T9_9PSEU
MTATRPRPATDQAEGRPDTRSRLLDAAEALFAERGCETVSLREIGRAAGAKNVIAAQYWFTDRDGLVTALIERHAPGIAERRTALLDDYERALADGTAGDEAERLHTLVGALVRPEADKLDDGTSGAGYLRTVADMLTRPEPSTASIGMDAESGSVFRWRALINPLLDADAIELHRRFHAIRFMFVELAQRTRAPGRTDHRLFVSQLVDSMTGLLGARSSAETLRLRERR